MNNRFAPELPKLRKVLYQLKRDLACTITKSDQLWVEAYSTVIGSNSDPLSVDEVQNILLTRITTREEEPWEFYYFISELIKHLPPTIGENIAKHIKIKTGNDYEHLQVTTDGHWQIAWEANPADDAEFREVSLDWFIPPDQDNAPIVPLTIIDCISSCVLLLRKELVLPAASVLSIALEATLWDALISKGLTRSSERIIYNTVNWHLKKVKDRLLVTVDGADRNINELDTFIDPYTGFTIELRRTQIENSENKVELRLDMDKDLVGFFASDQIRQSELRTDRGLSTAMQRARSAGVDCLRTIPKDYDATLVSLRNNLIHLPSQGSLDQPIPLPGGGQLLTVEDLRTRQLFIYQLLYLVIGIIKIVYTG